MASIPQLLKQIAVVRRQAGVHLDHRDYRAAREALGNEAVILNQLVRMAQKLTAKKAKKKR